MDELGFDVPVTFGLEQHKRIRSASELYGSAARGATVALLLGACVLWQLCVAARCAHRTEKLGASVESRGRASAFARSMTIHGRRRRKLQRHEMLINANADADADDDDEFFMIISRGKQHLSSRPGKGNWNWHWHLMIWTGRHGLGEFGDSVQYDWRTESLHRLLDDDWMAR